MTSVTVLLAATGGGAQRSAFTTARALKDAGLDIALAMPQARGPFFDILGKDVPVTDFGTRNPIRVLWKLFQHLRSAKPDVVLSNQQHMNTATIIVTALARVPTKIVLIQRSNLSALAAQSSHPLLKLLPLWARWLWPRADKVIGVSKGVSEDLCRTIKIPAAKVQTIYNPVITNDISVKSRQPISHPWLHDEAHPVILGVGNLVPQKDFDTLVRAVALVRKEKPCRLIILGEGKDRETIVALAESLGIADAVALPGFLPNPYQFMANADVFVLSSKFEGLSRALVEALVCGAPCVATDCPSGQSEILDDGRLGLIVPMSDPAAMAAAILKTLSCPGNREDRVKQGLRFSDTASNRDYLALIEELTGNTAAVA